MKRLSTKMLLFIVLPVLVMFGGVIAYVSYTMYQVAYQDAEEMLLAEGRALA